MDTGREGRRARGRRRWLRVAAAAELLEVSEHTLRRWADAGVVPCRRTPSGQRQFLPGDLERFLEKCGAGGDGRGAGGDGKHAGGNGGPAGGAAEAGEPGRGAGDGDAAGGALAAATRAAAR
ncbi:MAG: helix-turn-helix domain-containing protein, partial [Deltaproteobacteria bacterium]